MHKGKPFFFLARRTAFSFLISRVQTSQSPSSNAFLPVPCLPFLLVSWKDFLRSNLPVECLYFLYLTSEIVPFVFSYQRFGWYPQGSSIWSVSGCYSCALSVLIRYAGQKSPGTQALQANATTSLLIQPSHNHTLLVP